MSSTRIKPTVIPMRPAHALRSQDEAFERLEISEERLRRAIIAGRLGTYEFDPQTNVAVWDDGAYTVWDIEPGTPIAFETVLESIVPQDRKAFEADVAAALDPNGPGRHDIRYRITLPDGRMRWIHADGDVSFEDGVPIRLVGTVRDVTKEQEAEDRAKLLARELDHRVKNLFALISGMVSMTARTATTPKEMAHGIRGRIHALAQAHALIQPSIQSGTGHQSSLTFRALINRVFTPYLHDESGRLTLSGPEIALGPGVVASLALVIHELATNAAKYGALSSRDGTLDVAWKQTGDDTIQLDWLEVGATPISNPPTHEGFGTRLIEATVRDEFRGTINTDWRPDGVHHHIVMDLFNAS